MQVRFIRSMHELDLLGFMRHMKRGEYVWRRCLSLWMMYSRTSALKHSSKATVFDLCETGMIDAGSVIGQVGF